jgi:hypothetical protein
MDAMVIFLSPDELKLVSSPPSPCALSGLGRFASMFCMWPICHVPDLASLGNVVDVCVGSMVYNI